MGWIPCPVCSQSVRSACLHTRPTREGRGSCRLRGEARTHSAPALLFPRQLTRAPAEIWDRLPSPIRRSAQSWDSFWPPEMFRQMLSLDVTNEENVSLLVPCVAPGHVLPLLKSLEFGSLDLEGGRYTQSLDSPLWDFFFQFCSLYS